MEPHGHIVHSRKKHIGFYVKTYALMWFKKKLKHEAT